MSSLSAFIRRNSKRILTEWDTFARSLPRGRSMPAEAVRDHAQAMLDVIAADLDTPQTLGQQLEKSKVVVSSEHRPRRTAASEHGSGRAERGFTAAQMVAELRVLRASVVRLWKQELQSFGNSELDDLIRFNEAVDQAVAESLAQYSSDMEATRERFLAILGHDLRNPISAIVTSASFLRETGGLTPEHTDVIRGMEKAGRRMNVLIGDLLDFASARLGHAIPITRRDIDLRTIINDVATEVRASYPNARIDTQLSGDLCGCWDAARLAQALTNLLGNAVQHGEANAPITVSASGDAAHVTLAVHNTGEAIPSEELGQIFEGMKHGGRDGRDRRHLGLGLFIVDKIVDAHEGTIDVESSDEKGTTFTIRLAKERNAAT